jgi:tetratricopeptide (TPR) repeat protein
MREKTNRLSRLQKRQQAILTANGTVDIREAHLSAADEAQAREWMDAALRQPSTLLQAKETGDTGLAGITVPEIPRPLVMPDSSQVGHLYIEGSYYISEQRYDMAIELLNQAVELDVTFSRAWRLLLQAYEALDATELALNAAQAVMALEPFAFDILKQAAILAERLEAWELASTYFKRYIRRYPNDTDACFGAAVALEHHAAYDEAARLYQDILLKYPGHTAALNNLAGCHMQLNRYEAAITGFEAVLERMPNFPRAILGMAVALDLCQNIPHALLTYRRYLIVKPDGEHSETVRERIEELETGRE